MSSSPSHSVAFPHIRWPSSHIGCPLERIQYTIIKLYTCTIFWRDYVKCPLFSGKTTDDLFRHPNLRSSCSPLVDRSLSFAVRVHLWTTQGVSTDERSPPSYCCATFVTSAGWDQRSRADADGHARPIAINYNNSRAGYLEFVVPAHALPLPYLYLLDE